jgi:hypothetical protein
MTRNVTPDDRDHGVGQALGEGEEIRSSEKRKRR